jgi:hypothetical protein
MDRESPLDVAARSGAVPRLRNHGLGGGQIEAGALSHGVPGVCVGSLRTPLSLCIGKCVIKLTGHFGIALGLEGGEDSLVMAALYERVAEASLLEASNLLLTRI